MKIMIKTTIATLIEKYFRAETTLEEEIILRNYFASGEVDEEWLPYKTLFDTFNTISEEKSIPGISFLPEKNRKNPILANRKWIFAIKAVASCILIVLVVSLMKNSYDKYAIQKDTYIVMNGKRINDSELAVKYANKQLAKSSQKIKKGLSKLEKLQKLQKLNQSAPNKK
jgi:hypothetical protein